MEHFNGRLCDELLLSEIFDTLEEARYLIDRWWLFCSHRRIQQVLGDVTLAVFTATYAALPPIWRAALAGVTKTSGVQVATIMHHHPRAVGR